MANIGMPELDIVFQGLGVSAVARGSKGVAVLIIKDDTDDSFTFAEYRSLADLTSTELAKYSATNQQYIKDCLEGTPLKIIVARMDIAGNFTDLLAVIRGKAPRNCWIGLAEGVAEDQEALLSWVKSENTTNKKRYKALVYKVAGADSRHVVNLKNDELTLTDERGEVTGEKAVAYLLGVLAGLPFTMSIVGKSLGKLSTVLEPASLDTEINAGNFILYSEDGLVKVARGVNSLTTTGQGITDDMKFIIIVESMDLIFTDIYDTWNSFYKGKYKNDMDNQLLLVGAINAYYKALQEQLILDPNFENKCQIDIEAQRRANIPKYGEEVVNSWNDKKAMTMTVGTNVFLTGSIKILNAMEDFKFNISM